MVLMFSSTVKVVIKRDVRYHLEASISGSAHSCLQLVRMVNILLFVQGLNLNSTTVLTVIMGRQ